MVEVATDEDLAEGTTLDVLAEIGGSAARLGHREQYGHRNQHRARDGRLDETRAHMRHVLPADVIEYTITVDLPGQGGGKQWVTLTDMLPARHQVRFLGWSGGRAAR